MNKDRISIFVDEDLLQQIDELKGNRSEFIRTAIIEKFERDKLVPKDKDTNNDATEKDIIANYLSSVSYTYKNYFNDGNKLSDTWLISIQNVLSQHKRIASDDIIRDIVKDIMIVDPLYLKWKDEGIINGKL